MLLFTLRMFIADIQKSFRRFWIIIFFLSLGLITITPFFEDDFYVLYYVVIILFSAMSPHITKIFYVLPFGSKLLRRYLHLRAILLSLLFITIGVIMTILSLWRPVPSLERGWLVIMSYVMVSILMSLSFLGDTSKKNKEQNKKQSNKMHTIILVFVIIMISASFISTIFIINFKLQLLISLIAIIVSETLLIIGLRKVDLMNYAEPMNYGILSKGWRYQLRRQQTDSKK